MHAHTQTKRLPLLQHQAANRIKRKSHNTTHQHNSRRPPLERRKPLFVLIINQTQSDSTRRAKRLHATLTSRIHPHSHSPQAYVHQSTRPWGHRTVWRGDVCTCSPGPAHSEFRAVQSKECVHTHTHTHVFLFCSLHGWTACWNNLSLPEFSISLANNTPGFHTLLMQFLHVSHM